jgi:hypothetical protein
MTRADPSWLQPMLKKMYKIFEQGHSFIITIRMFSLEIYKHDCCIYLNIRQLKTEEDVGKNGVIWRWLSFGMLHHLVWYKLTDVSEALAASIIRPPWWLRQQAPTKHP